MTARAPGSDRRESVPAPVSVGQLDDRRELLDRHGRPRCVTIQQRQRISAGAVAPSNKLEAASARRASAMPRAANSCAHAVARRSCRACRARPARRRAARAACPTPSSSPVSTPRWFKPDHEIVEPEPRQHLADRRQQLRFDDRRRRADRVDVALVELAEPARAPADRRATPAESDSA